MEFGSAVIVLKMRNQLVQARFIVGFNRCLWGEDLNSAHNRYTIMVWCGRMYANVLCCVIARSVVCYARNEFRNSRLAHDVMVCRRAVVLVGRPAAFSSMPTQVWPRGPRSPRHGRRRRSERRNLSGLNCPRRSPWSRQAWLWRGGWTSPDLNCPRCSR